jgi:hypothetical protein
VLLYRHLLQSLTTSPTTLTTLPKARVILVPDERAPDAITGLGFREGPVAGDKGSAVTATALYIVTTMRVIAAPVSAKGGEVRTIDETGAGLRCAAIDWEKREMLVARDEAIYLYSPEGRGGCYAYEGRKSYVYVYKHNLIIVSPGAAAPAAVRRQDPRQGEASDMAKITIFDLQNKLVAYTAVFRQGIRSLFCQWGHIFVYEGNGELTRLEEHTTSAKLAVLYKRNMFTLALGLARSQGLNEAGIAEIHRLYADYLYNKGDFDGAISQFVKTLGYVQPSYVIRKVS